jgi:asparaginyl-tRNA synthetase
MDLQSEHEKYICDYFGNYPVFVKNYPSELKAFYMKDNRDGKTVDCFDLLFPEIGEMIGGSVREDDYENLESKIKKSGISLKNLSWYLNLRRDGYSGSAGFGLGLERLIMYIGNIENIKDAIPFPKYYKV